MSPERAIDHNSSDFEALDYLESLRSEAEFNKDLETLLLEYLQKPSRYSALLSRDGKLTDHKGLSLVAMGEKAEEKYRETHRYDRIHAETDGLRGLEHFYDLATEGDLIVLAMPPGLRREGFGNVSMTNISLVTQVDDYKEIITYTIPTLNLSIERHRQILTNASQDLKVETTNINHSTRPDLFMSSHPMWIKEGMSGEVHNKISRELGFDDFKHLQQVVQEALEVIEDPRALSRRKGLIAYLAMQIVSFRNKQNEEGLLALGRTVRAVFALESAGKFEDFDAMGMIDEFKKYMHGFMRKQSLDKSFGSSHTMDTMRNDPEIGYLWQLQALLNSSPEARERLEASSCGGGGFEAMFNSKYGGDLANIANPSILQSVLGKSESSKDEDYGFDHSGKCVVCERDPKMLGPCEICEDCDRNIRAQVE